MVYSPPYGIGDIILLTYVPDTGTTVAINGKDRETIRGKNFNNGLLKIWLGEAPVTKGLKANLLGL